MTGRVALCAVTAIALSVQPVAARWCTQQTLVPTVIAKDARGGLVMATKLESVATPRADESVVRPKLRFRAVDGSRAQRMIVPVGVVLAPGLAVYRLPKGVAKGELVEGKLALGTVTAIVGDVALHAAPKVKAIVNVKVVGRFPAKYTTVDLTAPVPDDVVAMVIVNAAGKAMSYGLPVAESTAVTVYRLGACERLPEGTIAPAIGDEARVYWVDTYGRFSRPSAATKIIAGNDQESP